MGAFEQAAEARMAAAAKAATSYTAATGRDVPSTSYNPLSGMTGRQESTVSVNPLSGVGQYQTVDPNFTKVPYSKLSASDKETIAINAAGSPGNLTPQQYYESRGGINKAGYFGDSWSAQANLTDAEYAQVMADSKAKGLTGTAIGEAINAATDKKRIASGLPTLTGGDNKLLPGGAGGAAAGGASSEAQRAAGSAYALLLAEFNKYGLGALVSPLQDLIKQGLSAGEFSLALQNTDAYKRRFAANTDRIAKGLTALSPAEYISLEDQYQNIMRNYGLPASYYTKGDLGIQEGFNKLLANDVSATELEDRIMTAQSRVINANPEIKQALRSFYPDITDGDILAYTLDPTKALTDIKRKVTAAEIGGAALGAGLKTSQTAAEGLAGYGVTKDQAQKGYSAIAEFLPTGQKLSEIYQESPYTQTQAEQEIFNLANSAEAAKKRKRLSQLETGSFSGSSGAGTGALNRDRAASNQTFGAGSY